MRRFVCICSVVAMLAVCAGAEAAKKPDYTLPTKNYTVLQNAPARAVTPQAEAVRREPVAGESPVTGLPWEGDYLPMLVQISNAAYDVKVNGKTVRTSGIGKHAPWGLQYADVVYEVALSRSGTTRFTALFSDCFAQGPTELEVGPVRSTRIGQLLLCAEWQSGFVYGGGHFLTYDWMDLGLTDRYHDNGTFDLGVTFDVQKSRFRDYHNRVKGKKSPDNLSVDIAGLRGLITEDYVAQPRPFLFADESPYADGYVAAGTINLDWGATASISHFVYDESENVYDRYCGPGMKENRWALFKSFPSAQDTDEENQLPLSFANLIVQRVEYAYEDKLSYMPVTQNVGQGNADIFIGGRYIPGYWARASVEAPTVYYDDLGNELVLSRGRTFIAQMPPEGLCTFAEGKE